LAVHSGATRNVYIGNIEDFETFTEDRLKKDFGEFGEIELVNFLKEKNCAFVNYTNVSNAIKAIDGVKIMPEYANLRVAHGKDRCANPPRSGPQGASSARRSNSNGNGQIMAEPMLNEVDVGEDMKSDAIFLSGNADIAENVTAVVAEPSLETLVMHIDEDIKPVVVA